MTFDEAMSEAMQTTAGLHNDPTRWAPGTAPPADTRPRPMLKRASSTVVWFKAGWTADSPEVYGRIKLSSGTLCSAPITLTTEDLTASDWELVAP